MLPAFLSTPRLIRFASIAAGIAIFVAPFRASAGLRGAMLILAGLAILFAYRRAGQLQTLLPPHKALGVAVLAWLLSASLWSFLSPSPLESLSVVKRDILTPMLAFLVFYALTRTRADMMRWGCVLTAGLIVLTILIIRKPFDPLVASQQADYVTVGLLTAWIVTLAPLLAVLLFAARPWRRRAVVLLVIALPCLLISAWLSGNRTVWVCFAFMLVLPMLVALSQRATSRATWHMGTRSFVVVMLLLAVLIAFMVAAMQFRAQTQAPSGTGPLTFMLQDNRAPIFRVAIDMIGEHPWTGRGYANPEIGDALVARLETPWLKNYVQHAHNVVLDYMLQLGVTGAVAILALFAALGWVFFTRARLNGLPKLAGLCGVALVAGVFLRNMTDDFFFRHTVQFFGAAVGMLLGLATHRPPLLNSARQD